jgi:hypothetical protein
MQWSYILEEHGWNISEVSRNYDKVSPSFSVSPSHSWDMKNAVVWDVALCGSFLQDPHDATSQKTSFFIATTLKTSNPTILG